MTVTLPPFFDAKVRQDVSGGNDPIGDEAERNAREKAELWRHEFLLIGIPAIERRWWQTYLFPGLMLENR